MPLYFYLHDAARFDGVLRPALTASWRQRSFEPCRSLCAILKPEAEAFAQRYHTGADESLLAQVVRGLSFDRDLWRLLVGEALLYAAVDVPEFQAAPGTLSVLLASEEIRQAHFGTHDLTFGGFYRPDYVGWNDAADVVRLADHLGAIDPQRWTVTDLAGSGNEAADELEFAREAFDALCMMYRHSAGCGQVFVCEQL
jgi:hypothetical protein